MFPGSCCDLFDLWGGKGGWWDVLGWHLNAPRCAEIKSGKRFTAVKEKVCFYATIISYISAVSCFKMLVSYCEYQHKHKILCVATFCFAFDYRAKILITEMLCLINCLLIIHMIANIYTWKQPQASTIGCWEAQLGHLLVQLLAQD